MRRRRARGRCALGCDDDLHLLKLLRRELLAHATEHVPLCLLFAHRHCMSLLHTPTHAPDPQRYGVWVLVLRVQNSSMGITRDVYGSAIVLLGHRLEGAVLDTGCHLRREQLGLDAGESESDRDGEEGETHFRCHERTVVGIDYEPQICLTRRTSCLLPASIQRARDMQESVGGGEKDARVGVSPRSRTVQEG